MELISGCPCCDYYSIFTVQSVSLVIQYNFFDVQNNILSGLESPLGNNLIKHENKFPVEFSNYKLSFTAMVKGNTNNSM